MLMVRGTAALEAGMWLTRDLFREHPHEPGLANPRFPVQQHHLALAFLDLLPALTEHCHFGFPSDKGRQPTPLGHHLEPGAGGTLAQDIISPEVWITPSHCRHRPRLPQ